jgi:hypothetical protein
LASKETMKNSIEMAIKGKIKLPDYERFLLKIHLPKVRSKFGVFNEILVLIIKLPISDYANREC